MKNVKTVAIINDYGVTEHDVAIVQMIADEMTAKDIAPHYKITDRAIETRIFNLRKKAGCKNAHGLVALFFRNGLIK